jgi:hypothetical protein
MGLARVFDHDQAMVARDRHDGVHIGHVAVQVNRNDPPRKRPDRRLEAPGIQRAGVGIDVDEDGDRSDQRNRFGRRHEAVGGGDDLIARADAARPER